MGLGEAAEYTPHSRITPCWKFPDTHFQVRISFHLNCRISIAEQRAESARHISEVVAWLPMDRIREPRESHPI